MTNLKPVTVLRGVGDTLAQRLRALGVETTQDLLVPVAAALRRSHAGGSLGRTAPRAARGGGRRGTAHRCRVSRAPADAVQDRRRLRLSDFAVFLFHRAATERPRARRAHSLLRRSAPRPQGPGNRASGISAHRPERPDQARGSSHTDLSPDRGRDPGPPAFAGRPGARPDRRRRYRGLVAAVGTGRLAPAFLARSLARTCIVRPRTRPWICC